MTKYVQLVIFENESYDDVIGSPQAPYITGLSKTWANMTQSFAITHPSEPNYLALFSGSTQGSPRINVRSVWRAEPGQRTAQGKISFTGYAETMPTTATRAAGGSGLAPERLALYAQARSVAGLHQDSRLGSNVYRGRSRSRPRSSHGSRRTCATTCTIARSAPAISGRRRTCPSSSIGTTANNGVLILTFDENDGSPGNQIPTILIGNVNPGQYGQTINHYSVLRTIEDIFGVKALGNAASASPIDGVVK